MSKFLAYVFLLAVSVGLSVFVSIVGWGLTPRNWWAIIGAGLFGHVVVRLMMQAVEKE